MKQTKELIFVGCAVKNTSLAIEDYYGFAYIINRETNWTVKENAFDINGINGVPS